MAAKALPSQEALRQLLDYNPATGVLTWRDRDVGMFPAKTPARSAALCRLWNARYSGQEALTCLSDGYKTGAIAGTNYKAHRVIWKMEAGQDPDHIDHINGDRTDNRLANLRDVTLADNARNRRISTANKTGILGVHRWAHGGQSYWVASSPSGKKSVYFHCLGQALKARKAAEQQHGFHHNHGRAA